MTDERLQRITLMTDLHFCFIFGKRILTCFCWQIWCENYLSLLKNVLVTLKNYWNIRCMFGYSQGQIPVYNHRLETVLMLLLQMWKRYFTGYYWLVGHLISCHQTDCLKYHELQLNEVTGSIRWGLRVSFICIVVGQGNPTRGPEYFVRNSALPSFWRNYSGPRVGFSCPTTIHNDGYFFSPTLWLFEVLYELCPFRIIF